MKATELYDDKIKQKSNGAFYTPLPYVKLITEYLLEYIKELNTDKYIIIDRAAGSGNLFKCLPDNVLNKCWLNSIEEFEVNEIKDYFKDKLLGVSQYDALSFEVIPELKEYIDNEEYKYGLFQIREEINIKDDNKKLKYPDLDKMLKDIKKKIDTYYTEYIVNDLFKYELLK